MSSNKKTKVSVVDVDTGIGLIKLLSDGQDGVILNQNSIKGIAKTLSGETKDIEEVLNDPNNSKVISVKEDSNGLNKSNQNIAPPTALTSKNNKNEDSKKGNNVKPSVSKSKNTSGSKK